MPVQTPWLGYSRHLLMQRGVDAMQDSFDLERFHAAQQHFFAGERDGQTLKLLGCQPPANND